VNEHGEVVESSPVTADYLMAIQPLIVWQQDLPAGQRAQGMVQISCGDPAAPLVAGSLTKNARASQVLFNGQWYELTRADPATDPIYQLPHTYARASLISHSSPAYQDGTFG
jgi:hypothetical protein